MPALPPRNLRTNPPQTPSQANRQHRTLRENHSIPIHAPDNISRTSSKNAHILTNRLRPIPLRGNRIWLPLPRHDHHAGSLRNHLRILTRHVGLSFMGFNIGSVLGILVIGSIPDRLAKALAKRNGGEMKPEYRLPPMLIGAVAVPAGMFLYGWSAQHHLHWAVPLTETGLLGAGLISALVSLPNPWLPF